MSKKFICPSKEERKDRYNKNKVFAKKNGLSNFMAHLEVGKCSKYLDLSLGTVVKPPQPSAS